MSILLARLCLDRSGVPLFAGLALSYDLIDDLAHRSRPLHRNILQGRARALVSPAGLRFLASQPAWSRDLPHAELNLLHSIWPLTWAYLKTRFTTLRLYGFHQLPRATEAALTIYALPHLALDSRFALSMADSVVSPRLKSLADPHVDDRFMAVRFHCWVDLPIPSTLNIDWAVPNVWDAGNACYRTRYFPRFAAWAEKRFANVPHVLREIDRWRTRWKENGY